MDPNNNNWKAVLERRFGAPLPPPQADADDGRVRQPDDDAWPPKGVAPLK